MAHYASTHVEINDNGEEVGSKHTHTREFDPAELTGLDARSRCLWVLGRVWDNAAAEWSGLIHYYMEEVESVDERLSLKLKLRHGSTRFKVVLTGEGLSDRGPW